MRLLKRRHQLQVTQCQLVNNLSLLTMSHLTCWGSWLRLKVWSANYNSRMLVSVRSWMPFIHLWSGRRGWNIEDAIIHRVASDTEICPTTAVLTEEAPGTWHLRGQGTVPKTLNTSPHQDWICPGPVTGFLRWKLWQFQGQDVKGNTIFYETLYQRFWLCHEMWNFHRKTINHVHNV